jgi:PadR family transcriptional regulator
MPETDWTSQLRRGVLELCVLRLLRDKPSYGYEIVATLAAFAPLATGENTLYPLLRRLKTERALESFAVASPSGPPRQYFRLTALGRRRLNELQQEWTELARAIERCLKQGAPL